VLGFDRCSRHDRIGRYCVQVQLDCISAGVLEELGVAQPPADVGAVEAGDHGELDGGLRSLDEIEIPVHAGVVAVEFGKHR
jgi:hypothetical protein